MDQNSQSPLLKRPDYLVCTCMGVMYSDIVKAIHEGANSFEKLSEVLMVGTGCNSCIPETEAILVEENRGLK